MQSNIRTRAKLIAIIRSEMESEGFIEIETPIVAKPTPEGARDFLDAHAPRSRDGSSRCRKARRSTSSCSR